MDTNFSFKIEHLNISKSYHPTVTCVIPSISNFQFLFNHGNLNKLSRQILKSSSNFDKLFFQSKNLVYIEKDEILIGKGIILDKYCNILAVIGFDKIFSNSILIKKERTTYYNDACLKVILNSDILNNKIFIKLYPCIHKIQTIIISKEELNKLYE